MFTLKIDNHKGQIVELTHDTGRYAVIGIDGLTRPPTTINTAIAANIDGSFYNSSRMEQRNLVISIILRGKIEENRQALYQIFPCKTACTIYFENKNRNVKIDGYVETLEGDLFVMQERMQISIICPRPYFEDLNAIYTEISTTIKRFSFPFSISQPIPLGEVLDTPHAFITNLGDTDTGFTLTGEITKVFTTKYRYYLVNDGMVYKVKDEKSLVKFAREDKSTIKAFIKGHKRKGVEQEAIMQGVMKIMEE
jgi:hypothetical protein